MARGAQCAPIVPRWRVILRRLELGIRLSGFTSCYPPVPGILWFGPGGAILPSRPARVQIGVKFEEAIGQAARGGSFARSVSTDGGVSSAIPSICIYGAVLGRSCRRARRARNRPSARQVSASQGSRNSPGSGLGLSLVAAVANLHEAQIEMADNAPGLRIGGLQRVKLIPHDPALGRGQMRKPG